MQFWKWVLAFILILLIAAGIFFLTAFIIATVNNVSVIDLLKDWFKIQNQLEASCKPMLCLKK